MDRTTTVVQTGLTPVLLLATISAPEDAEKRGPVKIFVLAGQSNMEGQAVADLNRKDYNHGKGKVPDQVQPLDGISLLPLIDGRMKQRPSL